MSQFLNIKGVVSGRSTNNKGHQYGKLKTKTQDLGHID
jgi:hypothetical protein